jgi:hypothetical protein
VRQEEYYIPDIPMPQDFVPNYDMTNDTGAGYVPDFQSYVPDAGVVHNIMGGPPDYAFSSLNNWEKWSFDPQGTQTLLSGLGRLAPWSQDAGDEQRIAEKLDALRKNEQVVPNWTYPPQGLNNPARPMGIPLPMYIKPGNNIGAERHEPGEEKGFQIPDFDAIGKATEQWPMYLKRPYSMKEYASDYKDALLSQFAYSPKMQEEVRGNKVIMRPWEQDLPYGGSYRPDFIEMVSPSIGIGLHEFAHNYYFERLPPGSQAVFDFLAKDFAKQDVPAQQDPYLEARKIAARRLDKKANDWTKAPWEVYAYLFDQLDGDISKMPPILRPFYQGMVDAANYKKPNVQMNVPIRPSTIIDVGKKASLGDTWDY